MKVKELCDVFDVDDQQFTRITVTTWKGQTSISDWDLSATNWQGKKDWLLTKYGKKEIVDLSLFDDNRTLKIQVREAV